MDGVEKPVEKVSEDHEVRLSDHDVRIKDVSNELEIVEYRLDEAVRAYLKKVADHLVARGKAKMPYVGSLRVRVRRARPGFNFQKAELIDVPEKKFIKIVTSSKLEDRLNPVDEI